MAEPYPAISCPGLQSFSGDESVDWFFKDSTGAVAHHPEYGDFISRHPATPIAWQERPWMERAHQGTGQRVYFGSPRLEDQMSQLLEYLPWDSEFFGLSIGRATPTKLASETDILALLAQAQENGLRCLYFEADPSDPITVALVEKHTFSLVDVRVVLEHPFDHRPAPVPRYPIPQELVINAPRQNELARLQDISVQIGYTSRFAFDRNFAPGDSERLYRVWIARACEGLADAVLVARWRHEEDAIGLITCTLRGQMANIQLAGVHLDHRQRNVGTGLVQAALDWARAQGAQQMQVVTQARNVPAQRLYQQFGFFTKTMTLYYHKWL